MSDLLKPCPFCGNRNIALRSNGIGDIYALCEVDEDDGTGCGARTSDVNCETDRKAVERWNQRVSDQRPNTGENP